MVDQACRKLGVSKRKACKALGQARSTQRYECKQPQKDLLIIKDMLRFSKKRRRYGYRRITVLLVRRALRAAERRGFSGMLYLHPWELDPGQPILPMHRLTRWRHRVGLGRTEGKLRWLLKYFSFSNVRQCIDTLRTASQQEYTYGHRQ